MFLPKMSSGVRFGENRMFLGSELSVGLQCERGGPLEKDYLVLKSVGAQE